MLFVAFQKIRQVIDKKKGVQECRECDGRGVKVEVVRMGLLGQQKLWRSGFRYPKMQVQGGPLAVIHGV